MKRSYIFSILSLFFILCMFQNCGGAGLLPGQDSPFQSNGGGYSGFTGTSGDYANLPEPPSDIKLENGCSGKIQVYQLVGSSCDASGFSQIDFNNLILNQTFSINEVVVSLPTSSVGLCSEIQNNFIMLLHACDSRLELIDKSNVSYKAPAGQIIVEGEFYSTFGIFNIKN